MLVDACYEYKELTGEVVPVLAVYIGWFWLGPGAKLVDVTQAKFIQRFRDAKRPHEINIFIAEWMP